MNRFSPLDSYTIDEVPQENLGQHISLLVQKNARSSKHYASRHNRHLTKIVEDDLRDIFW